MKFDLTIRLMLLAALVMSQLVVYDQQTRLNEATKTMRAANVAFQRLFEADTSLKAQCDKVIDLTEARSSRVDN